MPRVDGRSCPWPCRVHISRDASFDEFAFFFCFPFGHEGALSFHFSHISSSFRIRWSLRHFTFQSTLISYFFFFVFLLPWLSILYAAIIVQGSSCISTWTGSSLTPAIDSARYPLTVTFFQTTTLFMPLTIMPHLAPVFQVVMSLVFIDRLSILVASC